MRFAPWRPNSGFSGDSGPKPLAGKALRAAPTFAGLLLLAGCATDHAEPALKPVEYKVPVAVSCVPKDFPGRPVYADTKEALAKAHALGADAFDKLITAGWLVRDARLAALEAQVDACR